MENLPAEEFSPNWGGTLSRRRNHLRQYVFRLVKWFQFCGVKFTFLHRSELLACATMSALL